MKIKKSKHICLNDDEDILGLIFTKDVNIYMVRICKNAKQYNSWCEDGYRQLSEDEFKKLKEICKSYVSDKIR